MMRYAWLGDAPFPNDARLISALEQSRTTSHQLAEVEQAISAQFRTMSEKYPGSLQYEHHLPEVLNDLQLRTSSPAADPRRAVGCGSVPSPHHSAPP